MWVYYFIKCGGLLGCILENVVGITHEHDGVESAMQQFLRVLSEFLPEFAWRVDVLKLVDYNIPHTRVRVFLRGLRKLVAATVPPCLEPFGRRNLRECLGEFAHTPRAEYTMPQQRNLLQYEELVRKGVAAGTFQMDDIVVCPADRSEEGSFSQSIALNQAPTLTTRNKYLVVMSVADIVNGVPDHERAFFRKLQDVERLTLQGLPPEVLATLSPGKAVFAAGNAYPVPLIIACIQPMLMAIHRLG